MTPSLAASTTAALFAGVGTDRSCADAQVSRPTHKLLGLHKRHLRSTLSTAFISTVSTTLAHDCHVTFTSMLEQTAASYRQGVLAVRPAGFIAMAEPSRSWRRSRRETRRATNQGARRNANEDV